MSCDLLQQHYYLRPERQADVVRPQPWGLMRLSAQKTPRLRPYYIRPEEHTSELQSPIRISYAVFCLKQHTLYPVHHIATIEGDESTGLIDVKISILIAPRLSP